MTTQCCNSCGFLQCNFGKPNPDPKADSEDWYTQANVDRLWEGLKTGTFLICHATDPKANQYGGHKKIKPGNEHVCLAGQIFMFMHIKIFEHLQDYKTYVKAVGKKVAMPADGMMEAIIAMNMGRTAIKGGLKVASHYGENRNLVYPTGFEKTIKLFNELKLVQLK